MVTQERIKKEPLEPVISITHWPMQIVTPKVTRRVQSVHTKLPSQLAHMTDGFCVSSNVAHSPNVTLRGQSVCVCECEFECKGKRHKKG